jgi:hypothetical protein
MKADLHLEHRWLEQFIGNWISTHEVPAAEGKSACTIEWHETGRLLQGVWLILDGVGTMPDGNPGGSLMTLGYDPAKGHYLGTWIGSMMTHMWIYRGNVDASGKILTLDCEGPDFENPNKILKYQDIHTFKSPDLRNLTSRSQQDDGSWKEFMSIDYHRQK